MCNVGGCCSTGWAEELPSGCPPPSAFDPTGQTMYRLMAGTAPTADDFRSHRSLYPDKQFNTTDCRARSVSVWTCVERCQQLLLHPAHKSKSIASVVIAPGSGALTARGQLGHCCWWLCGAYDPVSHAAVVELT